MFALTHRLAADRQKIIVLRDRDLVPVANCLALGSVDAITAA